MVNHGWRTASAAFGVKFWFVLGVAALLMFLEVALTAAADESKVKAGTVQVETGARKIGEGKIADGVAETAKGIGQTVVEDTKFSGQKIQDSGQAAEPQAQRAAKSARDGPSLSVKA